MYELYQGKTKNGEEFLIRYPNTKDAQIMLNYINTLSTEQTFIRLQGEQLTLEEEIKYLQDILKKIKKHESVHLLIQVNNKIVGSSGIVMKDRTESHEGVFGLSIAKDYRGQGLGKKLMELVLQEGEKCMPQLRIITLEVFSNNSLAQDLYKKFGFREFGRLPEGIAYKGSFIDSINMYKKIR